MQYTGSLPEGMIIPICDQSVDIDKVRKQFPSAGYYAALEEVKKILNE